LVNKVRKKRGKQEAVREDVLREVVGGKIKHRPRKTSWGTKQERGDRETRSRL